MSLASLPISTHRHVEIGHPVYALLFQSTLVLLATQAVLALLCLPMMLMGNDCLFDWWIRIFSLLTQLGLQFHSVTWTCVSYLRYSSYWQHST